MISNFTSTHAKPRILFEIFLFLVVILLFLVHSEIIPAYIDYKLTTTTSDTINRQYTINRLIHHQPTIKERHPLITPSGVQQLCRIHTSDYKFPLRY